MLQFISKVSHIFLHIQLTSQVLHLAQCPKCHLYYLINYMLKACKNCSKQKDLQICSHCHTTYYCSRECQKNDWKKHQKQWNNMQTRQYQLSKQQSNQLVSIIIKNYVDVYKIIYGLDQVQSDFFKERNMKHYNNHASEQNHHHSCCSSSNTKIYIPNQQLTPLQSYVQQAVTKKSIYDMLPQILKYSLQRYENIKTQGKKDNLKWDDNTQKYILDQVMNKAVLHLITRKVKINSAQAQKINSKQPMLYATANTWFQKYPHTELNFLESDFIKSLNYKGYALSSIKFCNSYDYVLKELVFCEKDARFEECINQNHLRNDRILWTDSLRQKSSPELFQLVAKIYSIPFELNKKANMGCLISQLAQISYFKENGYHKKHKDSDFANDTGKKFTVLISVNEDVILSLCDRKQESTEIILERGKLFILKSRIYAYQVKCNQPKSFLLRYWINGPAEGNFS